jgi:pyruvate formate lyase activating enzyme
MTGLVFSIERYALQDGPGIRTLVFLKGCPLNCIWCANPESQIFTPQILYFRNKCASCGRCIALCPQGAIQIDDEFGLVTDPDRCTVCGKCVDACYYAAREMSGEEMKTREVFDIIMRDRMFYDMTGGGVTVSGGEPLMQTEFVRELTRECRENGIHTAIETALFSDKEVIKRAIEFVDLVFVDVKHIDSRIHEEFTGVSNERIFENIMMIDDLGKQFIIRVPFIPGFNDSDDTQRSIYRWAAKLENLKWIEILPYHRLGMGKYQGLGRRYLMGDIYPVSKQSLSYLIDMGSEFGVEIRIGAR